MLTQVGVKQLTDFLRTVTAASDLVDCTLVNCVTSGGTLRSNVAFEVKDAYQQTCFVVTVLGTSGHNL